MKELACVIRGKNGEPIQQSNNLRGIRRYVGTHLIKSLHIDRVGDGEGQLAIVFDNGNTFQTNFADWTVLKSFVQQWKNVYGAPLFVNTKPCGVVSKDHPDLI